MYLSLEFILTICFILSVIQFVVYYLNNSPRLINLKKINNLYINNLFILLVFIAIYNIVLPRFFYPHKPKPGFTYCGPSGLDYHIIFLKFGLIAALTTHFIWKKISKYLLDSHQVF